MAKYITSVTFFFIAQEIKVKLITSKFKLKIKKLSDFLLLSLFVQPISNEQIFNRKKEKERSFLHQIK
jgi:hypothetical protein